jgi:hypothetical protein
MALAVALFFLSFSAAYLGTITALNSREDNHAVTPGGLSVHIPPNEYSEVLANP